MASKNKQNPVLKRDPKKERVFKMLADILETVGISVRREHLRRGQGWKASSGSCILKSSNLVLIDLALAQDDQIELLIGYIKELKIVCQPEALAELPPAVRAQLNDNLQQAA